MNEIELKYYANEHTRWMDEASYQGDQKCKAEQAQLHAIDNANTATARIIAILKNDTRSESKTENQTPA